MPADNCGHFLIIQDAAINSISPAGSIQLMRGKGGSRREITFGGFYVFGIFIGLWQFNRIDYVFWWRIVLRRAGVPKRPNGPHL